jgi:hypothetical protein
MGQNLPNCARSVPEVCPRQTHSNSLQPTQTKLEAIFDCLGLPTGLGLRAIPLHLEGGAIYGQPDHQPLQSP